MRKNDLANARKRHGQTTVLAEQSKISDVNSTIADNERKQEKLALFGLIAMGANVSINILSPSSRSRLFLIMWGFELYLKFAQGGGHIEKPKKKKPLSESEGETEIPEADVNAKLKPTQKQQRFYNWKRSFSLTKSTSEMPDNLSNAHLTKTESLQPLSAEWRRHNNT
jgi:hypothetical protein